MKNELQTSISIGKGMFVFYTQVFLLFQVQPNEAEW